MCRPSVEAIVDLPARHTEPPKTRGTAMTIAAVWNFEGCTSDQYEQVFTVGGSPIHEQPKRLSHVCYRTPTGIAVLDVWADEQSFAAFGAIIGPAIEAAGLTSPPQVYPVQGFMSVDGLRNP
jgi:hypothetical protein